jgi:hypothetical protein
MAAISTITINDTIEFCKRLSFNRNFGIGNSLEPAKTAANLVLQTVLNPPFDWWWNNQEISFTCSTTFPTSAITNVALSGDIVTLTTTNSWAVNDIVLVSGLTGAAFLNGAALTILPGATNTQVTAFFASATSYPSTADAGTLTKSTTQDYTVNIPQFSHIEHASVLDNASINSSTGATNSKWYELKVQNNLSLDSIQGRPQFVSPHYEDPSGDVTFRVMPAPSNNYPVAVHCQLAPPLITSLNQTWAPLPDFMQHIYTWGFLSIMWAFADDGRVGYAAQKFTSGLLSRAEGISEEERDLFINNWNMLTGQQQAKFNQGTQARGTS